MLFGFLNNKNNLKNPVDISVLKTDMHSHLIPGIDDGASTIEESLNLIRKMKECGFSKIITTPHIMSDNFKNNPEIILSGLEVLRKAVKAEGIDIEIEAAAEYFIDDGFEKLFQNNELLTFGDNYLLVELSYFYFYNGFFSLLFELNVAGYKVILAHPERYSYFHDKYDIYEEMKNRGLYFQLNTISLSGYYSKKVQKTAEKLIDLGFIDFAGSDIHNIDYFLNFKKTLHNIYLEKLINSGKLKNNLL